MLLSFFFKFLGSLSDQVGNTVFGDLCRMGLLLPKPPMRIDPPPSGSLGRLVGSRLGKAIRWT